MSNNRYVIRNCPANYQNNCRTAKVNECNCQDCTDCVMKQIVELCKNKNYFVKRTPNAQFSSGIQNSELAFDILQHLDIQEVE